jgi:hypothetical protein
MIYQPALANAQPIFQDLMRMRFEEFLDQQQCDKAKQQRVPLNQLFKQRVRNEA